MIAIINGSAIYKDQKSKYKVPLAKELQAVGKSMPDCKQYEMDIVSF